jgi:hypothetical protein
VLIFGAGTAGAQAPREPGTEENRTQQRPKQFVPPDPPPPPQPQLLPPPPVLKFGLFEKANTARSGSDQSQALLGRTITQEPNPPAASVIRAILGFVALLVLAYLGGHPRVRSLERRLQIAHLITAGLPFVFLGFVFAHPAVAILTPRMLGEVGPLLPLGLGWIGFVIGSRFEARALDKLPPGTGAAVVATTAIPVASILAMCSLVVVLARTSFASAGALRDALLLATAGAMAARSAPHFLQMFSPAEPVSLRLVRVIELEQLAGVFGMMMVSVYFRPQGQMVAWQLPGTAWLFITLGIGTTMGIFIFGMLAKVNKGAQFTAALLGAVAFTAGMASFLRLSPISVCFIAGAIVINLGGAWTEQVRTVLERMERPIYFLFLVIAGALWRPWEWQGWVLMAFFVSARFGSKWLAAALLSRFWVRDISPSERRVLAGAPMGALSLGIVVSAQDLYSGPTVAWIVTAVIGAAIVTEFALQFAARSLPRQAAGQESVY